MRSLLTTAIVFVGFCWSFFAMNQFTDGQSGVPVLYVLSIAFIASVCGLVDRRSQIKIGPRA